MAKLKPIKLKDKRYVFKAFENDKADVPAACIFKRFPAAGELYFSNLDAGTVDNGVKLNAANMPVFEYERFAKDCIESFEDLTYGDKTIETVKDFLALPSDASYFVLMDCYTYAMEKDEFSMGE